MNAGMRQEETETTKGEKRGSVRNVERFVDVVAGATSTTLKAGERVSDDVTSLTKSLIFKAIRSVGEVTAVMGSVALENARGGMRGAAYLGEDVRAVAKETAIGTIRGADEVAWEAGSVLKKAALGLIHGSSEVGAEFGKVCKTNAIGAIKGAGEISEEVGKVAKSQAHGFIEGGTGTVLHFEDGLLQAARKLYAGVVEIQDRQAERASLRPEES